MWKNTEVPGRYLFFYVPSLACNRLRTGTKRLPALSFLIPFAIPRLFSCLYSVVFSYFVRRLNC